MKKLLTLIVLLTIINSCKEKRKEHGLKHNIKNISFEMPIDFTLKKANSEDTEVYDIFSNKKAIGAIYFGSYYKPFVEDYSITEEKEIYNKVSSKDAKIFYTSNLEEDYKNGVFNVNYYYYYDTINENIAQVMLPKKSTKGSIGIYFDSVDIHKNKFVIISTDLSAENKKTFLEIFKTIKIKKK